jgi:hypothetical protein
VGVKVSELQLSKHAGMGHCTTRSSNFLLYVELNNLSSLAETPKMAE